MSKLLSVRLGTLVLVFSLVSIPIGARADTTCTPTWSETRPADNLTEGLTKSQGVTTDGHGWTFSWQGGLERTDDAFTPQAVGVWPRNLIVNNPTVKPNGTNHLVNTHFGDIDYYAGKIYAPYEDGSEGPLNNPDYQHPYIAVYNAKTLLYSGEHYALPLDLQYAGVPWVAIDAGNQVAYTAEWDMPHDRINVYNLQFKSVGFINLHYPAELGSGFHLSRIQGAKVYDGALYASRDDDAKTIFKIDLATGVVTKLFSLNPTEPAELEGLSIRPMPDGSLLHVIEVLDNDTSNPQTLSKIHVEFHHFGLGGCGTAAGQCAVLGCGDDLQQAQTLESSITQNIEDGQVFEIDKDPSTNAITSINHFGDSALWTGTYLAAESYRYALASKYLANQGLQGDARDFWTAQQADAKPRINAMVAKFHLLSNISKNWTDTAGPTVNPPAINLGGTVYKGGEPGNLMRACLPTDTPEAYRWSNAEIAHSRRVYGPLPWDDGKTYYCEQGTSRDAYAGTFFGLLTAFDLVGPTDKAVADTIRDDIVTMVNFTLKYYWNTPRPNGRISIPFGSNHDGAPCTSINPILDICGHDFENFDSPLFITTPTARLNLAEAAWHVVHADPGRSDTAVWDAVHGEELAADVPMLAGEMELDDAQPNSSYYKFNLNHLTMFDITKEETNPVANLAVRQAFGVMDSTTRDDVNAHFETLTYALTGDSSRLNDAVAHLRQWRDYYARIHTTPVTNNSQYCGTTLWCVPDDQMDSYVRGRDVRIPGTSTGKRAKDPLAVANRPPTDFLWQRPPWQLDGSESVNHYAPGIDYLLPYWMLRYTTEASVPAADPFPVWPGPVHN